MRRAALLLFVLFLVNLPVVSQELFERRLAREGRDVSARVLDTGRQGERYFVDYRLPESADPRGRRTSAQVDEATYERARSSRELLVRVVPDDPSNQRALGTPRSSTFLVVALLGDGVLLAVALVGWRRYRRWHRFEVEDVRPGEVTVRGTAGTFTAAAPEEWTARVVTGQPVRGDLHLVADHDLLPGARGTGWQESDGTTHVVHGRVRDTRAGRVTLEVTDGFLLHVETGRHRIRADIRDNTRAEGVLCFTPR